MLIIMAIAANAQVKNTMKEATKTLSCKLTTPELQKRKATIIAELKVIVISREELSDGYRYAFKGTDGILDKLNEFIKTERMCCDFFTFRLTVEKEQALLDITGPAGAKEFLKEDINL